MVFCLSKKLRPQKTKHAKKKMAGMFTGQTLTLPTKKREPFLVTLIKQKYQINSNKPP